MGLGGRHLLVSAGKPDASRRLQLQPETQQAKTSTVEANPRAGAILLHAACLRLGQIACRTVVVVVEVVEVSLLSPGRAALVVGTGEFQRHDLLHLAAERAPMRYVIKVWKGTGNKQAMDTNWME
jgi:hypothetical protein